MDISLEDFFLTEYLPNINRTNDSNDALQSIIDYTFVIWNGEFNRVDSPTGALVIDSKEDFATILNDRANIDHQVLLRKKPSTPENPSIEDDFDCVFHQANHYDNNSTACIKEKRGYSDCQYWQKCYFTAVKRINCSVVVTSVVALTISLVILLLITAVFSIYWLKKNYNSRNKADPRVEEDQEVTPPNGNADSNEYNEYNEYNDYSEYNEYNQYEEYGR